MLDVTQLPRQLKTKGTEIPPPSEKKDDKAGKPGKTNASPKDAIAAFVDAIGAKDGDAIMASLSEKTNKLLELQSKLSGKTVVDFFTSEEFEDMNKMPETTQ